jgi:hypothetical protein
MTTWNYRVFREPNGAYIIREVFYAEDGSILGCTQDAVEPFGRSLDELAHSLEGFEDALSLPVLTLKDIPAQSTSSRYRHNTENVSHEQLRAELGLAAPAQPQPKHREKSRKEKP